MKHQAWILRGWEDVGITRVVLARERGSGGFETGVFLVDQWCLGVKDAYATEILAGELSEFLAKSVPEGERESLEPACARKFVEGAVAYAQGFGFLPHRDFRKARKVFGGIDPAACAREFAFGKNGKPFFMAGPYDDEARVNRVLVILRARLGEDGFHYAVPEAIDDDADFDDEGEDEDALAIGDEDEAASSDGDSEKTMAELIESSISVYYDFLASPACPDGALVPPAADGFVTGICVLPEDIPAPEWQPIVFGIEPSSPEFLQRIDPEVVVGLAGAYATILTSLENELYEPMLLSSRNPNHYRAAREFCQGFVQGLALRAGVRAGLLATPEAAAACAIIERIARGDATTDEELHAWWVTQTNMSIVVGRAVRCLDSHGRKLRSALPPAPAGD